MKTNAATEAIRSEQSGTQNKVYERYVRETVLRIRWLSAIVVPAEACMLFLDYKSGFFDKHPLNLMNLAAELLLIVGSAVVCMLAHQMTAKKRLLTMRVPMIVAYRIIILVATLMFIFTDIYVRHKVLGAYIVFLFLLQVTPAYRSWINWVQFSAFGIAAVLTYAFFVSTKLGTLFSSIFIFIAFAVSTDYLRRYFTKQLEDYYEAKESNEKFERLSDQTIFALADAVEAKDLYTKGHSQRVAEYSREIARRIGYSEDAAKEVYTIGLMHDLGKIGVRDAVINKPGRLTDEEFDEIKMHPVIGYDILRQITELPGISEGARWHHERFDGRGYPDGLAGEKIPEIARIIAVADAYDAMTSNRSYRGLMPQADVIRQIEDNAGKQFDPRMAAAMLEMIKDDPAYTMHE